MVANVDVSSFSNPFHRTADWGGRLSSRGVPETLTDRHGALVTIPACGALRRRGNGDGNPAVVGARYE